jgi:FKBP-type peptidyl-prolyl cis-trans isomerase SlyD
MLIAKNTVVSFHYQVATAEGETVDQSKEGEPLTYLHGTAQIIPGLEDALLGKNPGDHVEATVPPERGYGPYDKQLDLALPMEAFPDEARKDLQPGFRFMAEHPHKEDEQVMFTVHAVQGDQVMISGNHPLAGQTLLFKVDVVEVRAATAEELSHGHAHGPGGHHH